MTDWNIQSRAHACTACGRRFADKESYHTLLFDEKAALNRIDVCQECRDKEYSDARERKGFISHWQGVYEAPPPPAPEAIQKENAESLLRKIITLNDPHYAAAAFILAVMLERKRLLKVKQQLVRGGQRIFIYEHPKSGDVFTIVDPDLQLNQLAAIQSEVANLLEHGLPATEAPAAVSGEAAAAEPPTAEAPSAEVPATETPTTEAPAVEAPAAEAPAAEAPAAEVPAAEAPAEETPAAAPEAPAETAEMPTEEVQPAAAAEPAEPENPALGEESSPKS